MRVSPSCQSERDVCKEEMSSIMTASMSGGGRETETENTITTQKAALAEITDIDQHREREMSEETEKLKFL